LIVNEGRFRDDSDFEKKVVEILKKGKFIEDKRITTHGFQFILNSTDH
jgi:hypothetical protein